MCLTLPARITSVSADGSSAEVDLAGRIRPVKLAFSPAAAAGEWVLVNADLAVAKITESEAREINDYLK